MNTSLKQGKRTAVHFIQCQPACVKYLGGKGFQLYRCGILDWPRAGNFRPYKTLWAKTFINFPLTEPRQSSAAQHMSFEKSCSAKERQPFVPSAQRLLDTLSEVEHARGRNRVYEPFNFVRWRTVYGVSTNRYKGNVVILTPTELSVYIQFSCVGAQLGWQAVLPEQRAKEQTYPKARQRQRKGGNSVSK